MLPFRSHSCHGPRGIDILRAAVARLSGVIHSLVCVRGREGDRGYDVIRDYKRLTQRYRMVWIARSAVLSTRHFTSLSVHHIPLRGNSFISQNLDGCAGHDRVTIFWRYVRSDGGPPIPSTKCRADSTADLAIHTIQNHCLSLRGSRTSAFSVRWSHG